MIREIYEDRPYDLIFNQQTGHGQYDPVPGADMLERFYNGGFTMGEEKPSPTREFTPEALEIMRGVVNHVAHHGLTSQRLRFHDVGCGFGKGVYGMQILGHDASGNEMNREWVKEANPYCQNRLFYGALESIEHELDLIDLFFCAHVLEHLPDPQATLNAMSRKLKRGGMAYLCLPNAASYRAKIFGLQSTAAYSWPMHIQMFTPESFAAMIREAGMEIVEASTRAFDEGVEGEELKPIAQRLVDNEGGELFAIARKP